MKFILVVVLSCILSSLAQSQELVQSPGKRSGRRLCGSSLADALALVCDGAYNVQFGKRGGGSEDEGFDYEQLLASEHAWPFLPSQFFRRETRGVVDECCYNSCSYNTLKSYCAKKN